MKLQKPVPTELRELNFMSLIDLYIESKLGHFIFDVKELFTIEQIKRLEEVSSMIEEGINKELETYKN
jgi:hypothetical protein